MRRLMLESASSPPNLPCPQAATTIEWGVTSTNTPVFSFKSSTPPADVTEASSITPNSFRVTRKQPALSFGFSSPHSHAMTSPQPLFGTPSFSEKPSFVSSSIWVGKPTSSPLPTSVSPSKSSAHRVALKGDGALSKAINRASMNRPAIIGRQEIAADELITKYLNSATGPPDIKTLASELADIAQSHPAAFSFIQHVFQEISHNEGGPAPHNYRSIQAHRQTHAEWCLADNFHFNFDDYGWGEDVGNYILRMIMFGVPPREIRAAVKKDMDWTHGQNHVDAKEVESIIDWMRGPAVEMVENSRVHGSATDFFRPSVREEKRLAKMAKTGEYLQSWQAGGSVEVTAYCRCSHKHDELNISNAVTNESTETKRTDQVLLREQNVFRFMDLPAEMRVWVYKAALVPTGYISLRSCAHHMPAGVLPKLPISIFEISKTLNKEADSLLFDNTIIVNACLESGSRPAIHRSQFPAQILPLIRSLVIVIDFTRMLNILTSARTVDWRAAQGLVGLEKLRICGIATTDINQRLSSCLKQYLEIILERTPADCEVTFGEEDGGDDVKAHMEDMVRKIAGEGPGTTDPSLMSAYAMGGARLQSAWTEIEGYVKKGCKSGFKEDFRFEERRTRGELDRAWLDRRQMEASDPQDDDENV